MPRRVLDNQAIAVVMRCMRNSSDPFVGTILNSVRLYLILGDDYQSLHMTDWEKFYEQKEK